MAWYTSRRISNGKRLQYGLLIFYVRGLLFVLSEIGSLYGSIPKPFTDLYIFKSFVTKKAPMTQLAVSTPAAAPPRTLKNFPDLDLLLIKAAVIAPPSAALAVFMP